MNFYIFRAIDTEKQFCIHGSVHRESNLIISNKIRLLQFITFLYMTRVLIPIIRSWYNCNYSFWFH